jgi:hypothetical protein
MRQQRLHQIRELPRALTFSSCGASRLVEPTGDTRIVSTERRRERIDAIIAAVR